MNEDIRTTMTPRQRRRNRPIDVARAMQFLAHAANPLGWRAMPTNLDGAMRLPPERRRQLELLGMAADVRKMVRQ